MYKEYEIGDQYIGENLKKIGKDVWDTTDIWEIVLDYKPLIAKYSKKKVFKPEDREDLYQEGHILAFYLVPKCTNRMLMSGYLSKCLRRAMTIEADRLLNWGRPVSLDSVAFKTFVEEYAEEIALREYEEFLEGILTEEQMRMVRMRLAGKTHLEMAKELGLSRDGVSKRMKMIWKTIRTQR